MISTTISEIKNPFIFTKMANYKQLKAAVTAVIKANGNKEITGQIMQNTLLSIINSLATGRIFMGVATPATNPGTPDANVFYLAISEGQYINFSGLIVTGEISILQNITTGWQKVTTNIAQADLLDELMSNVYSGGTGTVIPLDLSIAGYYNPDVATKTLVASLLYATQVVSVVPGDYYRLTIRVGSSGMAGVVFFNDGDQNVGTAIPGDSSEHVNQTVKVPYGATQMAVATSITYAKNKIEKVTLDLNARFTAIEDTLAQVKNATDQLLANPILTPIETTADDTGCFYNITKNKNVARGSSSYSYTFRDVTPGEIYEGSARIGSTSMALFTFWDANGNVTGYAGRGVNPFVIYENLQATVPPNTTQMGFAWLPSQPHSLNAVSMDFGGAILDLNARVTAMETTVEDNNNAITATIEVTSKNVNPGNTVGGYVNSDGGFSPAATQDTYAATDLIPVKPNTYYYISNRNVNGSGSITNIRCLDENKANPTKVRIASTGGEYLNWYTPNAAGTGSTDNGQIKTSPTAAYLQMNLKFNYQGNPDYAKLMLQEVGDTYDPSFLPSAYQPYDEEYKVKKSALPDDIGGGGNTVGTISLNNTPMFLLVGASHGEGFGSVKDKAFISYLSGLLDWSVENYSRSGSDYIEHFNSLAIGQSISNVYPGDMAGGIALVALGGNESNYYTNGVDAKYFRANIIRCCSALKSLGYRPILASYYGDMGRPWALVVREVAREYGYMYYDINGYGSRFYSPLYRPWWYNAHYATRTNGQQWYSFMKLLADIERPQTALKIFRNRNPYTQIGELLFDNNFEKMRYWRELTLHHNPLKTDFEKYVDRLDLVVYTDTSGNTVSLGAVEGVPSEYNAVRRGGTISMDDTGLLQFTFPAVGRHLKNVKFHIESDDTLEVYIRKYVDPTLQISLADASAAFGITTTTPNIVIGDVYTDSNNPGVNFTVTQFTGDATLIATPDASFSAPGNTTGTLTRTSGTGAATLTYNTLRTAPGATYFANGLNKLGTWKTLNGSNGVYELQGMTNYLDYDRCDILVKKSGGGAFVLKSVSADYEATQPKDVKRYDTAKMLGVVAGDGTQILTKTTFENPQTDWGLAVGKGVVWDGQVTYTDANGVQQTGNHIPTYFSSKKGVTQILRLDAGDVLQQALPTMQGATNEVQRYKLKLTARYYPTEALDINNLPADVRTSKTFDFARIDVRFVLTGANSYYTRTYYAPLQWVEIEDELVFDAAITVPNQIQITAVDARTEFMLCEIERI